MIRNIDDFAVLLKPYCKWMAISICISLVLLPASMFFTIWLKFPIVTFAMLTLAVAGFVWPAVFLFITKRFLPPDGPSCRDRILRASVMIRWLRYALRWFEIVFVICGLTMPVSFAWSLSDMLIGK